MLALVTTFGLHAGAVRTGAVLRQTIVYSL